MPAQNGLRLDDEQCLFPGLESTGEQDEETALGSGDVRAFDRSGDDDKLLTEQQIFRDQCPLTPGQSSDGAQRRGVGERLGQPSVSQNGPLGVPHGRRTC